MAMAPERSKPLHNFSLPCLKWGTQRFLRCKKIPTNTNTNTKTSPLDRRSQPLIHTPSDTKPIIIRSSKSSVRPISTSTTKLKSIVNKDRENRIEAVREKLMLDLGVAVNNMEVSIIEGVVTDDDSAAARPWNLRTRRAACKAPPPSEEKRNINLSPTRGESANGKASGRLRGVGVAQCVERKERVKFSVSLSKEEVDDDFVAMIGKRPPRRPKKRAKIVQRQLDSIFPGLWLTEITPDSYKVPDIPESGKV